MLKITFDIFVPYDGGFIDEGWGTDSIYCKDDLSSYDIKNLVKHHVYQTEITKYKDISIEIVDKITGFLPLLYSKYERVYEINGEFKLLTEWQAKCISE